MITEPQVIATAVPAPDAHSYVDWPAVFAGAVFAAAIAILLLAFGSAIGLTMVSPMEGEGVSVQWFAIAAAAWLVWVSVSSVMAGSYLTGRLRRRINDATEHEVDIRDGAHGLVVWAASALIVAALATIGIGGIAGSATDIASTATKAVIEESTDGDDGEMAYLLDAAFRTSMAPVPMDVSARPAPSADAARAEVARILRASLAAGEVSQADRDYVAQVVQATTGIDQDAARMRVDTLIANAETAAENARIAAEKARKAGVLLAFVNAAALLAAAVGAFIAGGIGGRHRDEGIVFSNWGTRLTAVR